MLEFLDQIDKQWLLALNNDYPTFWDNIVFIISQKLTWIPLYLSIIYLSIVRWRKDAWVVLLGLVLSIVFADQIASGLIKNWVARPRPTHDIDISHLVVTVNGYTGGAYGFVSSHASNSFALATLSALLFRERIYTFFIFVWAIINSYSRIYLGVHYVGDILGGIIVGILVAWGMYWLITQSRKAIYENPFSKQQLAVPISILLLTFLIIIVYSGIIS